MNINVTSIRYHCNHLFNMQLVPHSLYHNDSSIQISDITALKALSEI